MNKLIKVAIVGTGHIAEKFHLPAWQKNKKIKIVAICDINQKKLDLVANKFKVKSNTTFI